MSALEDRAAHARKVAACERDLAFHSSELDEFAVAVAEMETLARTAPPSRIAGLRASLRVLRHEARHHLREQAILIRNRAIYKSHPRPF